MKILAAAIALATLLASPVYAKTPQPRHPAAAVNHLAPNSPFVGDGLGLETTSRRLSSTLRCMIFRVTGTSLIERRDLFSEQHEWVAALPVPLRLLYNDTSPARAGFVPIADQPLKRSSVS